MRTNVLWVQRCGQLSYRCVELRSVEQGLWEMTSAMRKHHVAACHPPWPTRPQFAGSPAPRSGVALQKAFSRRHPSLLIPSPTARSDGRTNAIISMGKQLERGNFSVTRCPSFAKLFLLGSGWRSSWRATCPRRGPGCRRGCCPGVGGHSACSGGREAKPSLATDTGGLSLVPCVLGCLARSTRHPNMS